MCLLTFCAPIKYYSRIFMKRNYKLGGNTVNILVTGATGQLGGKIVDFLLEKIPAESIVAGTRNTKSEKAKVLVDKGIEVRQTDFEDKESLVEAFKGIDKVFVVSTFGDMDSAALQQKNVSKAAQEAGVKLMVYSSAPRADTNDFFLAAPHLVRENIIKESGIPYVFVRNNWYFENELATVQNSINGAPWVTSAGNGKVGWVLRSELAEATAAILATDGHENKVYEFGGANLTQTELVAALNEVTGKDIQVMSIDDAAFKDLLKGNLPDQALDMLIMVQASIRDEKLENHHSDLEQILGRKPATAKEAFTILLK